MAELDLTRPIIGIENRSAQEVFDIMCDRFKHATPTPDQTNAEVSDERLRELLPCPFCGWAMTADEGLCKWDKDEFGDTVDEITYTGVCCPGCSASVPINAKTADEAIAAWNRRSVTSQASEGEGWKLEPIDSGMPRCRFCGYAECGCADGL